MYNVRNDKIGNTRFQKLPSEKISKAGFKQGEFETLVNNQSYTTIYTCLGKSMR